MHHSVAVHAQIVRSSLALGLFVLALLLGTIKPIFAPYLWFAVSGTSFVGPDLARRLYGAWPMRRSYRGMGSRNKSIHSPDQTDA
jgi:hypothetical protein